MNPEQVNQMIRNRLQQAHETLLEADLLMDGSFWRGAINRAYYAMFYSALALTVAKNKTFSKHSGVISFFDQEFVKTGIFPLRFSRMLHIGFDRRQSYDYGELSAVE